MNYIALELKQKQTNKEEQYEENANCLWRLAILLNLSSKQLLKMWIILFSALKNVYGSTKSECSQLYIGSDKESWRPFHSIVYSLLVQVCGVLEQCLLCFFHCSDLSSEGLPLPLHWWILPVPYRFLFALSEWVSLWMPVQDSCQNTDQEM